MNFTDDSQNSFHVLLHDKVEYYLFICCSDFMLCEKRAKKEKFVLKGIQILIRRFKTMICATEKCVVWFRRRLAAQGEARNGRISIIYWRKWFCWWRICAENVNCLWREENPFRSFLFRTNQGNDEGRFFFRRNIHITFGWYAHNIRSSDVIIINVFNFCHKSNCIRTKKQKWTKCGLQFLQVNIVQ